MSDAEKVIEALRFACAENRGVTLTGEEASALLRKLYEDRIGIDRLTATAFQAQNMAIEQVKINERLTAENEALRKDADRYDQVKRMRWSELQRIKEASLLGKSFDAEIDAALAQAKDAEAR